MSSGKRLQVPSYRLHKPSGRAVVTLNGRDHYLGRHGTAASKREYSRVIAEWLANNHSLLPTPSRKRGNGIKVTEVLAAFWRHAKVYYVKNGKQTSEVNCVKAVIGVVRRLYGHSPVKDFGPLALKAVRQNMIDAGLARNTINSNIGRIKRAFQWAVENELIAPSVYHGLQAVSGLRAGRSDARETAPVKPVPEKHVEKTLPHLSAPVAAMVRLQMLTGARSGEVVIMRTGDIDRSGPIWIYTPRHHKTEHHGHIRTIVLGPKAQETLKPFLRLDPQAYLFSPAEAEAARNERKRRERRTPMTPSQARRRSKRRPKTTPQDRYTPDSYRKAVGRACANAEVPHWHPHQLRHNFATLIRRRYGLEAARAALGHRSMEITQVYAEVDQAKVAEIVMQIG